jgi:hypothetical protein
MVSLTVLQARYRVAGFNLVYAPDGLPTDFPLTSLKYGTQ